MGQTEILPLLQGVPVGSDRGALGWSSSVIRRSQCRTLRLDTESYGDRSLFFSRLEAHGLGLHSFDAVVLSHFHFDHMVNTELFTQQTFFISEPEWDYVRSGDFQRVNDPFVPLAHISLLQSRMQTVCEGQELAPGVRVLFLPGHTPGSMGLYIQDQNLILAGDAVKNRHDFAHSIPPPCFDTEDRALASMHRVRGLASNILPGHDTAFSLAEDGRLQESQEQQAVRLTLYPGPERPPQDIDLL